MQGVAGFQLGRHCFPRVSDPNVAQTNSWGPNLRIGWMYSGVWIGWLYQAWVGMVTGRLVTQAKLCSSLPESAGSGRAGRCVSARAAWAWVICSPEPPSPMTSIAEEELGPWSHTQLHVWRTFSQLQSSSRLGNWEKVQLLLLSQSGNYTFPYSSFKAVIFLFRESRQMPLKLVMMLFLTSCVRGRCKNSYGYAI